MYHGILVDSAFIDDSYASKFKLFAKRKSKTNPWTLYGIEILDADLDKAIDDIRSNTKSDKPYYSHIYNDEKVIVVFKDKTFVVTPHQSTWKTIIAYGKSLYIPEEQLDFWPNRFQDEIHYFANEDLLKG